MTRAPLALAGGAIILYLVFAGAQLGRPLMYDDANFALAARAVAETGLPFGNQGWMSERGDFSQREQWALWHPPLYVYALGAVARLGGWTPPMMRILGLLGGLASLALTGVLAADLTRGAPARKRIAAALGVALVATCPLVVQSTLVLDIDFALLLPLTLAFLILYLRLEHSHKAWLWLAPVFALLLWAKMTNPLPLVGVIVVWQLLRARPTRAVLHLAGIGGLGVALFGASWSAVGRALGFPLEMPFGVNLVQWQDSADVARRAYSSPGAFIDGLQPAVLWLGPGLVSLGLVGAAVRVASLARCWRIGGAELLTGVALAFVLGYVNKSAGWFPKYEVALAPLLACLAAPCIAALWCARPRPTALVALAAALAGVALELALVRDDWALQRTWAISYSAGAWLVALVVLSVLLGVVWRAPASSAVAALVGIALGWSVALDGYQLRAEYQTDYWYGTTGTRAAVAWVDAHLVDGQTYLAAKEVGVASRDLRYVDEDNLLYLLTTNRRFDGTWAGEPLHALVLWQREPYVATLFERTLPSAGFQLAERFGDYVVYVPAAR